jgi:AI-2 transport protein TqsA
MATFTRRPRKIYLYIRGKVGIALLVASCDALILSTIGVSLWLVFAIVTFWLVFIPNVGLAVSLFLPMPIVLLDPHFGIVGVVLAFAGPLAVGLVAKDVLEPLVLGHSTSLTPVAVLLAVMLWATVWGITGMVLAVPLTAVIRIYLQGLDHPLAKFVANVLAGKESGGGKSVAPL